MKRFPLAAALFGMTLMATATAAWAGQEPSLNAPLRSRNHHPIFVSLLNPPPEEAEVAPKLTWDLAINHSSIFVMGANNSWYIHMDKELTEYDLSLRAPLGIGKLEVGVEVPVFVSSAGFLDSLVRNYHSLIGVEGYNYQDHFPDDFYVDKLYKGDRIFHLGREGRAIQGDVTLWLKGEMYKDRDYLLSFQAFVQPPTGDTNAGIGSGFWEYGARALASGNIQGAGVYMMLGVYAPGGMKGIEDEEVLKPIYNGFAGFEWILWDGWAFLAQVTATTSPMAGDGNDFFSKPWIDSTFGFKKVMGDSILSIALSENLNQTAPDFTIHISLRM